MPSFAFDSALGGSRPMDGLRIVDLTANVAGPLACQVLCDLGAEVIKVEPPMGEAARHITATVPGFEHVTPYFSPNNRGKKSVRLDLGEPADAEELERLVAVADVVVQGMRPGTMERHGLGPSRIGELNPGCVYVSISAYGGGSDLEDRPGIDMVSSGLRNDVTPMLACDLGLRELSLVASMNTYGATANTMVAECARAIADGTATTIACVFADTRLRPERRAGAAWSANDSTLRGYHGWQAAGGAATPNVLYALAARRHMEEYGTTTDQLAAIAVAQRQWALGNPHAQMRTPMTIEDHHVSPWIADPLRRLDCCLVSNGAIAIVVTSAERAADLAQPAVHVWGYGQAHRPRVLGRDSRWGLETAAGPSSRRALRRAGLTLQDVDLVELYDCYTYTVLVTLEDYGFCAKGEGGAFVENGRLAPGGDLASNTGGGQLSGYYMWGFTPLSEAVIQVRGHGGDRQVPRHDIALVSGNGGILEYHSTLVLSSEAKTR